ncbi:MAG: dTDP-glucose 4,6-dehydratase [Spirochaetaceae bacterium]|jgi:dTDP-glucose 4,6-dehydratase|nr:dTDP-glucose 4,6-dehydratase [Spirochaetaceae bacterium]
MRKLQNVLVTGGLGFIGSNFIRTLLKEPAFTGKIINLDKITYAGNPASLKDVQEQFLDTRYFFEKGDITERGVIEQIFIKYHIDTVVHFAAESHVDRSILGPENFIKTNVLGTFTLLETARHFWLPHKTVDREVLFHHISTDEVYGSLGTTGSFSETSPYDPHSPYSASKAASDHLVLSYYYTYGLPVTISNCSNNYGPYQFPEKFIPLSILNIIEEKPLPVYGNGKNIRDWIYVGDHNRAVLKILNEGGAGQRYNIGGDNEWENIRLLHTLIDIIARKINLDSEKIRNTIKFVKDRPGHDLRYAIDCSKIKKELGWKQDVNFTEGLSRTVDWYLGNQDWAGQIRSGDYQKWIEKNYEERN